MTEQDVRLALGQRIATGLPGEKLTEDFIRMIREYKIGNVLLFRRNIRDEKQLKILCRDLHHLILEETGLPPFLMIDEEGGNVARLAPFFFQTPCSLAVGATGKTENAYSVGKMIGGYLRETGINFNLAPVLDCLSNPKNQVIGNRCFGQSPQLAADMACAYTRGLQEAGILACGKHFPGHGDTAMDSHTDLPVIRKTLAAMEETELLPFRTAVSAGIDALMIAHICFPELEDSGVPATFSRKVIQGLLRDEMNFKGLVISDGMEMNAVMKLCSMETAVLRAMLAGIDIALICHSTEQVKDSAGHLREAWSDGQLDEERILEHARRIREVKETLGKEESDRGSLPKTSCLRESARIIKEAVRMVSAPNGESMPSVGRDTLFFGIKAGTISQAMDESCLDAAGEMAKLFGAKTCGPDEPRTSETAVVFLCPHPEADCMIHRAAAMAEKGTKVIAVSLYTGEILDRLPDTVWKIHAWQYDELALTAVAELLGKKQPE